MTTRHPDVVHLSGEPDPTPRGTVECSHDLAASGLDEHLAAVREARRPREITEAPHRIEFSIDAGVGTSVLVGDVICDGDDRSACRWGCPAGCESWGDLTVHLNGDVRHNAGEDDEPVWHVMEPHPCLVKVGIDAVGLLDSFSDMVEDQHLATRQVDVEFDGDGYRWSFIPEATA